MNWMKNVFDQASLTRWSNDDRCSLCTHVEADRSAAYAACGEFDSFGTVDMSVLCSACYHQRVADEKSERTFCDGCGQSHQLGDLSRWVPYDFYPPQGDEPTLLCDPCWDSPKWVEVRRRDAADADAEYAAHDSEDGDVVRGNEEEWDRRYDEATKGGSADEP